MAISGTSSLVERVVFEATRSFAPADRQRHHEMPFHVPAGVDRLQAEFFYAPGAVASGRNQLSLRLHDPRSFRGAGHRWAPNERVIIDAGTASPGYLAGPIPAGEWLIAIDAHQIHDDGPVTATLRVTAMMTSGATPEPGGAWPSPRQAEHSVPGRAGWYRADLHSHTGDCDGSSTAAELAAAATRTGIEVLAITNHNTVGWTRPQPEWPSHLLRIRGIEVTTFHGHMNVLGSNGWIDWRGLRDGPDLEAIFAQVDADGALCVMNHPLGDPSPDCAGCRWSYERADLTRFDAIEVWNSEWLSNEADNPAAVALWETLLEAGHRPTALAGSDVHSARQYPELRLPSSLIWSSGRTEQRILNAVRAGRVVLSSGPTLAMSVISAATGGARSILPGSELPDGPVALTARIGDVPSASTLWLIVDGETQGSCVVAPGNQRVEFHEIEPRRWCRLELRRGGDRAGELLLLTNPLYSPRSLDR